MKNPKLDHYAFEIKSDIVWVHFPNHSVVHADPLEHMLNSLLDNYPSDMPILLDLSTIDGFSIDAFEIVLSLVSSCDHAIALLSSKNHIGHRYAHLLEMSCHNQHTRNFHQLEQALSWLRLQASVLH